MSGTVVADATRTDLTVVDSILEGLPAGESGLLPAIGTVQKEEVDVAQAGLVNRLLDGSSNSIIRLVTAGKLGGVENVLALQASGVLAATEKVADGLAGLTLVAIHLGAVKASVATQQS